MQFNSSLYYSAFAQGFARKGKRYDKRKQVHKKIFHAAVQMHGLG